MCEKIGNRIREVLETAVYQMRGKEARIMKVRVNLDVTKVLKSKLNIGRYSEGEETGRQNRALDKG